MSEDGYLSFLTDFIPVGPQTYLHHKLHSDIAAASVAKDNITDYKALDADEISAVPTYTLQVRYAYLCVWVENWVWR
ncbi:hypothetical protein E2C01_073223 [Portunus trituberculatus]|uniref:Uncharacterized protein n=1 Tax=Portunus trituberculatus TaxID=210409 RepID=A0A5B7IA03_PORTR|nr:hypothetical protein [Portunus trituberculatus]